MKYEICLDKEGNLMVARVRDYRHEIAEYGLVKDYGGNDHVCFRVFCEGEDFEDCLRIAKKKLLMTREMTWVEYSKQLKKMEE